MTSEPAGGSQGKRRRAHAAWAALCLIACLYLTLTKQTGHPPPIVLVPFVLVAWVLGHGLIWGGRYLAAKGQPISANAAAESRAWPVGLRLVLVGMGAVALLGMIQVIGSVLLREWYPYSDIGLWVVMLAVALAHSAAFLGLLLRRRWSRLLSATLTAGWALMLGRQIAERPTLVTATDTVSVLIASGLIVLLLLFAAYLAWSRQVKSFLVN